MKEEQRCARCGGELGTDSILIGEDGSWCCDLTCVAYYTARINKQPPYHRAMCGLERPTWPETWMDVAKTIAERGYDPRLKVGTIIVSDDNTQVLSVGYNGNYKGGPNERDSMEPGQGGLIHAEVNALVKLDFNFPKGKHMYVTHSPCRDCAKLIINAGITRVVWETLFRETDGLELLKEVGLEVLTVDEAIVMANEAANKGGHRSGAP